MKILTSLALLTVCALLPFPAKAAVIWTHEYTGAALPDDASSSPQWTRNPSPGIDTSATVSSGILTISSPAGQDLFFSTPTDVFKPGSNGATVEVRLRIDSQAAGAGATQVLRIYTGERGFLIGISHNKVQEYNVNGAYHFFDTTDAFHIYRFTVDAQGEMQFYLDNDPTPIARFSGITGSGAGSNPNRLAFGAFSTAPLQMSAGVAEWDYIRWTNDGTLAPQPVPEPSPLALGLVAGGTLLLLRRSRLPHS